MTYFNLITVGAITVAVALGIITAMYFNQDRLDRPWQILFSLIVTVVSSIQVGVSLIPIYEPFFEMNDQRYLTYLAMTTFGATVTLNLILQTIYYAIDRKRERDINKEDNTEKNEAKASEEKTETK